MVDLIDIEIPGEHVKSLTCASQLIQQVKFSKKAFEARKKGGKQEDQKVIELQDTKLIFEEIQKSEDTCGEIFIKAEWKVNGPNMPPIRSENLLKKPKLRKNRKEYS